MIFNLCYLIGWGRCTGKVTDDEYRPVEVKVNAKANAQLENFVHC